MNKSFTITLDTDKVKAAKRTSRNIKIPTGGIFKNGTPKPGVEDDSLADPRIEMIGMENNKSVYLVDKDVILERFSCNLTRMEYPKCRFVPKDEIWVTEEFYDRKETQKK